MTVGPTPDWVAAYSRGVVTGRNPSFYFDFPAQDGVHYITMAAPALSQGQRITLKFRLEGSGTVKPVQGTNPYITLYFQRKGDNLSAVGELQQYRYFSHTHLLLNQMGEFEISEELAPAAWGDARGAGGDQFPDRFKAAIDNVSVVGFVFGDPGAGATGHGCYATGPVRFTLLDYRVS